MLTIMLVDDETTVLQGISHILNRYCPNYEIAFKAQSALDALGYLEHRQVDVVITDVNMPDMDGIELTKSIRTLYPHISVVVLSGYADFEYVRQTMKYGACDYLLKPCHYKSILDILYKIEEQLTEQGARSKDQANKAALQAAIAGKQAVPDFLREAASVQMVVAGTESGSSLQLEELISGELKKGSLSKHLLEMAVQESSCVMLFNAALDDAQLKETLCAHRQSLLQKGIATSWICRSWSPGVQSLEQAYKSCIGMLDFLRFHESSLILTETAYEAMLDQQKQYPVSSYFSGQALGKIMLSGDVHGCKQHIEAVIQELRRLPCKWEPSRVRNDLLKELLLLERHLEEHGYQLQPVDYMQELRQLSTFRGLTDWLKRVTANLIEGLNGDEQTPQFVLTAIKYMETHYMDDICLKSVSDAVFLNPWYFSSQFKKYMQVSFSEYLNQVRVKMAKQLLKQKDLKVYQVAEMVGFQDAAYFSTVFKQQEQMSPKDFQKTVS